MSPAAAWPGPESAAPSSCAPCRRAPCRRAPRALSHSVLEPRAGKASRPRARAEWLRATEPAGGSWRETAAPEVTLGRRSERGARGRSRGRGERCCPPPSAAACVCATPLGRAWESARPLHTFLKPRAPPPPPAVDTRVPAAPPPPRPSPPLGLRSHLWLAPGAYASPAHGPLGPEGQGCPVAAKRQAITNRQADGFA